MNKNPSSLQKGDTILSKSSFRAWVLATRPPTLTAAVVPVAVGTALAFSDGKARTGPALAALVGALLIQIGTNFANDLFDFEKGADTEERIGPTRAVQSGLITPHAMRRATLFTFAAALLVGLYLVSVAGWPIVVVGMLSIVCGLAYTGGPWPLGYHGLGDLFVFLFFGVVAVVGTYFVQALHISEYALLASLPVGLLVTAIIVVNNFRDSDTDRVAGKRTLAVRLGRTKTRIYYALLMTLPYVVLPYLCWREGASLAVLAPWLSLPWAIALVRRLATHTDGPTLNHTLRSTAKLHALFGLLFALGIVL